MYDILQAFFGSLFGLIILASIFIAISRALFHWIGAGIVLVIIAKIFGF